jgi:hypothetical protein
VPCEPASFANEYGELPSLTRPTHTPISFIGKPSFNPNLHPLNFAFFTQFEELVRATPAGSDPADSALQKALDEITVLASNMNEGKREAETRRKLVQWQSRIRGKFPSPLVQPHRRLIMDGLLHLTRVVRKTASYFEVPNPNGEKTLVSVECLSPELTPRSLIAILCNDLLVLCKDPTNGKDPSSTVDLWAVLRMQTVSQPASIVHGNGTYLSSCVTTT